MPSAHQHDATIWRQRIKRLATAFTDTLLPPACANCSRVGSIFCEACEAEVQWLKDPICQQCGRPQEIEVSRCDGCRYYPLPLKCIRAATLYSDPVRRVIHQMKYEGYFALAAPLADLMSQAWPKWRHAFDLVVPIPLHSERQRKRGYNQSQLIIEALQRRWNWVADMKALERERHTRPQVGLSNHERQLNVYGAFSADSSRVAGKKIMLVDDLYTTGSTLGAAADALLAAGAKTVTAYCLAVVGGFDTIIA